MKNIRWYIAAFLFFASVINYVDRQTLSVVAPQLTKELHMSPVEYSNVLQAFLIAYTIMYLGSGFLVDLWGTKVSLAAFMAFWSVSNMLHAFARTPFQLGIFRALLGIGEPGNFMAGFKAISEWFPPKERAFVNGLQNGGASVGAIIAPPLIVWLMMKYDWRMCFVITGAIGLVWLVGWLAIYGTPPKMEQKQIALPKSDLLKLPQTWGLLFAKFFSDPVWWFYLFWLPKYLVEQRHFTNMQMGMLAWLPYLTADLGAFGGGIASGWLIKRGYEPVHARKIALLPCALLMPLSFLVPGSSSVLAMVLISVLTFAHMAWKTNLMALTNDIYPFSVVGSVSGIIAFGSGVGSTLFTNLTGQVVQHYSYTAIFVIMGFLHPLSYLIVRYFIKNDVVRSEIPSPVASGTI
jgi:ACS family hexuronate transporter-like MFS transporter